MKPGFFRALLLGLACWLLAAPGLPAAQPSSPSAKPAPAATGRAPLRRLAAKPYLGAVVLEAGTGEVLFEQRADAKGYPASVLKLMDLLLVLERIERRELAFGDQVPVSAKAARAGGSRVRLAQKESFSVDEMLYALMVQSANDAAVALAEKVAGSTAGFVKLMNQRAAQLGLASTTFQSVHGLPPAAGQLPDVTTARDLARLCREVLQHPDALRYTATRSRPFRSQVPSKVVLMTNHNPLLGQVEGCDGLKTGWIDAAGYSIAATASRHGQRLIVIVLDCADRKLRDQQAAELLAKGFAALAARAATPSPAPPPPPRRR